MLLEALIPLSTSATPDSLRSLPCRLLPLTLRPCIQSSRWESLSSCKVKHKPKRVIDRRFDGPKDRRTRDYSDDDDDDDWVSRNYDYDGNDTEDEHDSDNGYDDWKHY